VYNLQGRAVRQLYAGSVNPGPQDVIWNGRDDAGRNLATGVYLARVTVGGTQKLVKMTLVK
ncbi:MAG: flagellar hook assembly protein FlgD, partial [Candidatus Krumholzibacteriia bacterium]